MRAGVLAPAITTKPPYFSLLIYVKSALTIG